MHTEAALQQQCCVQLAFKELAVSKNAPHPSILYFSSLCVGSACTALALAQAVDNLLPHKQCKVHSMPALHSSGSCICAARLHEQQQHQSSVTAEESQARKCWRYVAVAEKPGFVNQCKHSCNKPCPDEQQPDMLTEAIMIILLPIPPPF